MTTGEWFKCLNIKPGNIQDISVNPQVPQPRPHAPPEPFNVHQTQAQAQAQQAAQETTTSPSFVDPAIVSIGKHPGASLSQPTHNPTAQTPTQPAYSRVIHSHPADHLHDHRESSLQNLSTAETEVSPGAAATSQDTPMPLAAPVVVPTILTRKSRTKPDQARGVARQDEKTSEATLDKREAAQTTRSVHKNQEWHTGGHGWRQTPILQSMQSFQPFSSLKKSGKGRPALDGWMAQDVKGGNLEEFDFESNLAKFQKDMVFNQYRKADKTNDADRLVSHNRLPKPGTAGGRNLHHTENVLDMATTTLKPPNVITSSDFWNSEAENGGILKSDDRRYGGREPGNGRSSRPGDTKVSTSRRSQSRKANLQAGGGHPIALVNPGVSASSARPRLLRRNTHSRETVLEFSGSSQGRHANTKQSATPLGEGFYLVETGKRIQAVSPLQMLNVENIAHNEVGLTEEMMTENAARGIAKVTLIGLKEPAVQIRHQDSTERGEVTVVIMAGNNKSGVRAVAAGRHLRNKGVNVLLCVVGIERECDLLDHFLQQIRIFRNMGGRVFSKKDLFDYIRKTALPSAKSAPAVSITLIIDALLGLAVSFEELGTSDQASVYELIQWANRNDAFVLAVDVPTGIDPSTGRVNSIEGDKLYVKPRYVASIAAPKRGILHTLATDGDAAADLVDGADEWRLFIVDLGLGTAIWRKSGARMRRGIDFHGKWVQEIKLRDGSGDNDQ